MFQVQIEDIPYEEDVLRNPYIVKNWIRYLQFKEEAPSNIRNLIFERALKELPGSYKLWMEYLRYRKRQVRGKPLNDVEYEEVNNCFERCLVYLNKMPRVWLEYVEFLIDQKKITKTRKTLDQALKSLSVPQHDRIWKLYMKFIKILKVPVPSALKIHRRYLKWNPKYIENFIEYLIGVEEWDEAAQQILKVVNEDKFEPTQKNKHDYWMLLCDIISKHSDNIKSINVDKIIRGGLTQFSDEVGKLWTTLADYYIRLSYFDKARDIFEEAMNTVITIKDFAQIWDAYAKFEDTLIASEMATMENDKKSGNNDEIADFDLRIARYENLIERQPFLVNNVLLRQNPHNVHEWQKRVNLYQQKNNNLMVVETYSEALKTINPLKAKGKPHILWINFAKFYEVNGDIESARKIFEKASEQNFRYPDDIATVWCEYAEMELRHKNYENARQILQKATTPPRIQKINGQEVVQRKAYRSTKLWSFYADIEECLGSFLCAKAVYEKMFDLKVITPQIVINYAYYLEENKYFEESFKAYEKGISLFNFPFVLDIWVTYLTKFISRYGGKKLERARELFEQVIESAPSKDSKIFYVMYANLEEEFGLARRAMSIYDRATRAVAEEDRFSIFCLYINKATEFFGIPRTREIYEKAIEVLPDKEAKIMCLRYADLEKKLGEIDRARAIFVHGSQFSDPRLPEETFWNKWREFEVEHGNEDTFREMLRIKRSVQAQFNTQVNVMSVEMMLAEKKDSEAHQLQLQNQMQILEKQAEQQQESKIKTTQFSSSATQPLGISNPEEIKLDEEDNNKKETDILQLTVPQSVFDKNVPSSSNLSEKKSGALERLKKQKKE